MEQIVFLERDSLEAQVRRPAFAHSWEEYGKPAAAEVVPRLARASIAIVNKTALRAETIARLPALKLIAVAATGTDNIDVAACRARGIVVSNIRNYAVHTVPEHTFALILALRRNPACGCCSPITRLPRRRASPSRPPTRCCARPTSCRCICRRRRKPWA